MNESPIRLQPLVLGQVPLHGRVLIEASAGTGKTWTIAALYVRLLLERGLSVENILVLSFTNKASAELRERILSRLTGLRDALRDELGDERSTANAQDALLQHLLHVSADRHGDALRLAAAIENFDLAPIHTIHAFCQRALGEHAFDSALSFQTELIADESALYTGALRDSWRRAMTNAHPLWAQWLYEQHIHPDSLLAPIRALCAKPQAQYYLPAAPAENLEAAYVDAFESARKVWHSDADAAFEVLTNWKPLNRKSYTKAAIPRWRAEVQALFDDDAVSFDLPKNFFRFTQSVLREKCEQGEAPQLALFDALGALQEACAAAHTGFDARWAHWQHDLAHEVAAQLDAEKRARGLQSYDDVLRHLHAALQGEAGDALARTLRERYSAALIDEFQDTDPLQYDIFERIYADSDAPRYFVGDPKQAIYAFRGADIYAYLQARKSAQSGFTLDVNRRSSPSLVRAVNALFTRRDPFLFEQIEFNPVAAHDTGDRLQIDGEAACAPLQCWFMARESATPITKGLAAERAVQACAGEIARLLNAAREGRAHLIDAEDTRALAGGDIAVLVQTHVQARSIKTALAALGIASVTYGQDSVYHSVEAIEIERVLAAVAEPTHAGLLRAALATLMLGRDAQALTALQQQSAEWDAVLERYARYQRLAREHGFIRMWRALLIDEGVAARLLAMPDGERRLTNLQHVADLLHQAQSSEGLDLQGLTRLLSRARAQSVGDAEAQQLRLESDANLVQILTLHSAKGLEFPIVFCPFLWDGGLRADNQKRALPPFHDEQGRFAFALGAEQAEKFRARARIEEFSEVLRLAYVALTRAKHRCVFIWGGVNQAQDSALAWLLHGDDVAHLKELEEKFPHFSDAQLRAPLEALQAANEGAIELRDLNAARAEVSEFAATPHRDDAPLIARRLESALPKPWRVSSFSGLISAQEREAPDYDAIEQRGVRNAARATGEDLFGLPGGMQTGTLIHQLFEAIDFRHPATVQVAALVRRKMAEFGLDPRWAPVLEKMLVDVTATPLDEAARLRLDCIAPAQRLVELEFLFPVGDVRLPALREALQPLRRMGSRLPDAIGELVLAPSRGYIRGFIDLVFEFEGRYYLADYKSNYLGAHIEDYAPAQLSEAMSASWYDLQYLLYGVALHRHLRLHLADYDYERHFGGAYYLFVRAMRPAQGCTAGIYFTRPARALIEALDAALYAEQATHDEKVHQ